MRGRMVISAAVCGLALAFVIAAGAANLTGRDVIERLDEMGSVQDLSADLEMRLINKDGQERVRQLTLVTKRGGDGSRKMLMRFRLPADVKGTGFLSFSRPGSEDESWLFLPALGKPRRIASEERGSSFMGSDFTYADIGLIKIDDHRHTLLRTEQCEGEECFVVESLPISEEVRRADGFARKTWWIRTESYTVSRAEFTDKTGKLLKALRGTDVVALGSGAWLASRMEMKNLESGTRTVITFKNIKVNTGVADDYFSTRQLTKVTN